MTDMPVIPVVFNYTATITDSNLKGLGSSYFVTTTFKNAELSEKNYEKYLAAGETFVRDNFEELEFQYSKDCSFKDEPSDTKWTAFTAATTVYSHFVADKKDADNK